MEAMCRQIKLDRFLTGHDRGTTQDDHARASNAHPCHALLYFPFTIITAI
jgi:hypothetical protein